MPDNMIHDKPGRITPRFHGPSPGTRETTGIIQTVEVFPHGECDVVANVPRWLKSLEATGGFLGHARSGLRPFRYSQVNGHRGGRLFDRVLSKRPWSSSERHPSMPAGYAGGAGETFVWVEYLRWYRDGLWGAQVDEVDEKAAPYRSHLELSLLRWHFPGGKYETSFVIELHQRQVLVGGQYYQSPDTPHLEAAAVTLAALVEAFVREHAV
jgi:hypothetical protein